MRNFNKERENHESYSVYRQGGVPCHIKGSRQVVEQLQYLIAKNNLKDQVELGGTFCMGKCQQGVCVTVDDAFFSLTPDTTDEFFQKEILAKVK